MKRLMGFLLGVLAVACVGVTEIAKDREFCFFPGDTATLTPVILPDSTIVACQWGIVERVYCHDVPVTRYTSSNCVEGTKWKWPQ